MAISIASLDVASADAPSVTRRYAWGVFAILFALMVVDYVDRQVVVSMFPHLKAQWSLSDAQLGTLVSVISIIVAAGTLPLSMLADRWSRVKSIFVMALLWSAATIGCAFATTYGQLLFMRGVVGLGEAAYGSAGAALLATVFPARMRSTVLGAFLAAGLLGSVLGVMSGGVIAHHWGWQAGFGAVGVPGLVLAVIFVLFVRDYRTVKVPTQDAARTARRVIGWTSAMLFRPRTAIVACVAAGLQLVMVSSAYAWLPSFFNRFYGLRPDQAGIKTAVIVLVSGLGAVCWSVLADRLSVRKPLARVYVCAATAALTAVLMTLAFAVLSPGPMQFWALLAGAVTMTGTIGPAAAIVVDVVHPGVRATAAALLSLTQNLFGLAAGPLLAGLLSDRYGLEAALAVTPVFCLLSAGVFLLAARTYKADLASARAAVA